MNAAVSDARIHINTRKQDQLQLVCDYLRDQDDREGFVNDAILPKDHDEAALILDMIETGDAQGLLHHMNQKLLPLVGKAQEWKREKDKFNARFDRVADSIDYKTDIAKRW